MVTYSCDFETTTDVDDCRVWAWVAIDIDNTDKKYLGNDIESFIEFVTLESCMLYFHNLKFDGEFILHYLLSNGFEYSSAKQLSKNKTFTTLISDMGSFYSMCFRDRGHTVFIRDSLKLLNFKVSKIAKDFHLPISKLEIDYKEKREKGHCLTQQEKDYIINDALIVAMALKIMREEGFKKLTIGSNAFNWYTKSIGGKDLFRKKFPVLPYDEYIRKSYKGGFTYAAPQFKDKEIGSGIVLDVNSLYPFSLSSPHLYPVGKGEYFEGEYIYDDKMPLYVQRIICSFKLKKNHIPTIQIKGSLTFCPTEYLTESGESEVELTLTSVDLKLFFDHYDVTTCVFIDGYKFKGELGLFDNYIQHWYDEKKKAKLEHNGSMYAISKLMLNSLYGKFATRPERAQKIPFLSPENTVSYMTTDKEKCEPIYIPVGTFCTAYARDVTIRAAQSVYHRFLYADTDSLHLIGTDIPKQIEVDDTKLGAFKLEGVFDKAKYLRAKMYMEHIREPNDTIGSERWTVTGAGMPEAVKNQLSFDKFEQGWYAETGKLKPQHCPGGIVLVDIPFTIR